MAHKMLDVLEEQHRRRVGGFVNQSRDLKEQIAALLVRKAMLPTEARVLGDTGDTERLAREARGQEVVLGDRRGIYVVNVARRLVLTCPVGLDLGEVGVVRLDGPAVELNRVGAGSPCSFKAQSNPAYACEQVDEAEWLGFERCPGGAGWTE